MITIRRARTHDARGIAALVTPLAQERVLLGKELVTFFEDIQEFVVAQDDATGRLVGCGALHVFWEDLAEVRTLAVADSVRGQGVGHRILDTLLEKAGELGVARVFCLTFETAFFGRHGFTELEGEAVSPEVFAELLRSMDDGVAEFLDLARVKPNTLGNTRMIRHL